MQPPEPLLPTPARPAGHTLPALRAPRRTPSTRPATAPLASPSPGPTASDRLTSAAFCQTIHTAGGVAASRRADPEPHSPPPSGDRVRERRPPPRRTHRLGSDGRVVDQANVVVEDDVRPSGCCNASSSLESVILRVVRHQIALDSLDRDCPIVAPLHDVDIAISHARRFPAYNAGETPPSRGRQASQAPGGRNSLICRGVRAPYGP